MSTPPAAATGPAAATLRGAVAQVARGSLGRYLGALGPTGVALAMQFATFAITARGLGVARFGQYAAVVAIAAILVEVVGAGGADLLVRAVARDRSRGPAFFGNMLVLLLVTLPPTVAIGVLIEVGPMRTTLAPLTVAVGLLGEIIAARIGASTEMNMIAYGHTFRAACVRVTTGATRFAAAGLFFLVAHARSLDGWVWMVLAQSCLLGAILLAWTVLAYGAPKWVWLRGETGAGLSFALNQASRATQTNVDRIVLSHFATDVVVGIYAAGSRLLVVGLFPIQVMTRILYPNFFRHGADGMAASRRYAIRCIPAMLAASLFSLAAIIGVAEVLPVLLGRTFAGSRHTASLLALAMPLIGMQYLAADALTGAGHQHVRVTVSLIASGLFGLSMALGAAVAGVEGVIVAFLASHCMFMVALWGFAFAMDRSIRDGNGGPADR